MTDLPKIEHLNEQEVKEITSNFKGIHYGFVRVGNQYFLPSYYAKDCSKYYNFNVKSDDVWTVTFPRSGTTLTQEMVWLLGNDMNFEVAKAISLIKRFPFFEDSLYVNVDAYKNILQTSKDYVEVKSFVANQLSSSQTVDSMQSPRYIKTHFPFSLMPNILKSNCKVIYVARNPKDVAVSYYHFEKSAFFWDYEGNFEKYWHYFQNNQLWYSPYWEHVKEAWALRHNPNLLFLFYEEIVEDLPSTIRKVSKFLEKSYSDEQYEELHKHLQFSNFQNNEMVNLSKGVGRVFFKTNNFIREGKRQAWQNMFTPELNITANRWIEDNLRNTDLKFPFVDIYA